MREAIGAALQEAALDPLLTGREHMRLQTALHGVPKARARRRGDELLERVGLTEAADRRVGGYSGGMKRRLDLALALVHRPRILFLDEPTTGLDPQSRTALWEEVERLADEDGMTVFLTTQYLEEADASPTASGSSTAARSSPRAPPRRSRPRSAGRRSRRCPRDPAEHGAWPTVLLPLRRARRRRADAASPSGSPRQRRTRRGGPGARQRGHRVADLQLHAPTLDDVFLEKTGRKLEGAGPRRERGRRARRSSAA